MPAATARPGLPRPRPLAEPARLSRLAAGLGARLVGPDAPVLGATAASTLVHSGDLFLAIPGRLSHGAQFAPVALAAGAVGVLTDAAGAQLLPVDTAVIVVADPRAAAGPVAAAVYGRPSARVPVSAITGTSGKTTTSFLVRAGLVAAGRRTGLIGTVGTFVGDDELQTGFTTPEAAELQALLAVMLERGVSEVVMEVSSHGLELGRVSGTDFTVAGFTNLSQDHLDFHPTMEAYFAAKARLFAGWAQRARIVVDDEWGRRLAAQAVADEVQTVATSVPAPAVGADWRAEAVVGAADGRSRFRAVGPAGSVAAATAIPGAHNVANALLALALLDARGVPLELAAAAIADTQVPGRMERIDGSQPFLAVVDYAHKPAAVAAALQTLRPLTRGRLITVLGCGGDRDRAKRPVMGEVASAGSDLLIVTDDNPRSEEPAAIRAAMLAGTRGPAEVQEIADRAEAIRVAVSLARAGDTVLVAGKGHERSQEIAGQVFAFDDRAALRAALRAIGHRAGTVGP